MRRALAAVLCVAPALAAGTALARPSRLEEYRSVATVPDPADSHGRLDLVSASFGQEGDDAYLSLRTRLPWTAPDLAADHRRALCVEVAPRGPAQDVRLCVEGRRRSLVLRSERLDPSGNPTERHMLEADLSRPDDHSVDARVPLPQAGLGPGRYRWQARSTWIGSHRCRPTRRRPEGCVDLAPDETPAAGRFVRVHRAGCEPLAESPFMVGPVASGPGRPPPSIALTFDDGPSPYTPAVLRILERERANATFFLVGQFVSVHADLVRRMLQDGDAVGNHSWSHPNLSAGGPEAELQLSETSREIGRASGFQPCLFRPPYGAWSPTLIHEAQALGMTTVLWNVDPRDWTRPAPKIIDARVLRAVRPGSIVLLHDGGGPRPETVAALPPLIRALRSRGYRLDTVPDLLGMRPIYVR